MCYKIKLLIVTLITVFCLYAQKNDSNPVLDKMYNDILNSIPASQRHLIDSSLNRSDQEKNNAPPIQRESNNEMKKLPESVNRDLINMMNKIDTMRQKRIIHFMTTEPLSD